MITKLPDNAPTERQWNFNDEIGRNYMLYIPADQPVITAALHWRKTADSKAHPVGKYRFDLPALEAAGYVRFKDKRYFLRFQWPDDRIEVAINRHSPVRDLSRTPIP